MKTLKIIGLVGLIIFMLALMLYVVTATAGLINGISFSEQLKFWLIAIRGFFKRLFVK